MQRLILTFKDGELVIHTLYHTQEDSPGPNTKARCKEVTQLTRIGLRRALASLDSEADVVVAGTSGFFRREDILVAAEAPLETQDEGSMT